MNGLSCPLPVVANTTDEMYSNYFCYELVEKDNQANKKAKSDAPF